MINICLLYIKIRIYIKNKDGIIIQILNLLFKTAHGTFMIQEWEYLWFPKLGGACALLMRSIG